MHWIYIVAVTVFSVDNRRTLYSVKTNRKSLSMIVTKRFAEYTSLSVEIQLTISVVIGIDIIGRCSCNYSIDIFQPNIHVYFYPGDRSLG